MAALITFNNYDCRTFAQYFFFNSAAWKQFCYYLKLSFSPVKSALQAVLQFSGNSHKLEPCLKGTVNSFSIL